MTALLIIIGIIVLVVGLALCSTVSFEIVSNGKKTVITASMYKFIKCEFTFPKSSKGAGKKRKRRKKKDKTHKTDADKGEIKKEGKKSAAENAKKDGKASIKKRLSPMWDSDIRWFDFEYIQNTISEYKDLIKYGTSALATFLSKMRRKIRIERLDLYIKFGLGEPDKTGIAYGMAYGVAGELNGLIMRYFKTKSGLVLYLDPDYVNPCFEFELGSIIKTRAAFVLYGLLAAFVRFIFNYLKGSVGNVRNFGQASD